LLALLGAHLIFHVSRLRVNLPSHLNVPQLTSQSYAMPSLAFTSRDSNTDA
jgi:hypothetical protein